MDARRVSFFVAVAEEQPLPRAAIRVSIAQPAVSHQIRRLEAEARRAAFHRDPRTARWAAAEEKLLGDDQFPVGRRWTVR